MLTVILLLLIAFVQFIVSLGIFLENRRKKDASQKLFVLLSIATFFWITVNVSLLYVDEQGNALNINYFNLANKVGFMLGALSLLLVYIFNLFYPEPQKIKLLQKLVIASGASLIVLSVFDFISGTFVVANGLTSYEPGVISVAFALFGLLVVGTTYIDKTKILRSTKNTLLQRQIKTLLAGLTLTIAHALIFIILIPLTISDSSTIYAIGYLAPYYFIASTVYSLTKQKLFDVRLIVARSLAYLLSIGLLTIGYGLVSSIVLNKFFADTDSFWTSTLASSGVLIVAVLSYQPIKNFFDRVTNRIFYRDAYDPQQFLNDLNDTVVENIEAGILLRHTTSVIQENIKSQFCYVEIKGTPDIKERLIGTGEFDLSQHDSKILKEELIKTGRRTIITDDLDSNFSELRKILFRNNIGLLIRLMPGSDMSKESLYYLIIGNKKSGNVYDKQDIRLMEIIADELLIAIQNSLRFEEIQQFNVTLQQKVNDATEKLQKTNKKLREMDETKDEFISMASHQLRTPLTSVKGYLSMVLDGDAGKLKGNQKELLDQAFVSSQRMVYLIADLLNVSRLKTGKFLIDPSPTNLAKVIESEISQLKEVAKGKKVTLTYDKPANFPQLMLDETKIRQVIMNFVDNAIYYTPNGGKVKVEVKEDKSNVYFTVKDDGIGIPQSEQSQLFTKFYRASNARKARPDGTGLGLFMAKKVVNAQGGEVLFESKEDKGSTFGFTFKKAKLEPEPKQESSSATVTS